VLLFYVPEPTLATEPLDRNLSGRCG
jgi:hypothetical protein